MNLGTRQKYLFGPHTRGAPRVGLERARQDAGGADDRTGHDLGPADGVAGLLHEPGLRPGRVRILPEQEHRQHPLEELHRLRHFLPGLLSLRLGPDVRKRQRLRRVGRHASCSAAPTTALPPATPTWAPTSAIAWTGIPLYAKFFFQLVFAGTAATIVSGSVAERIKYLLVHRLLVPPGRVRLSDHRPLDLGRRLAGGGGFWDFAGSTVVHSVGGWAALAGILVLGPRLGQVRPRRQGERHPRPQHDVGRHRLLCAVARLVRIQSGIDHGRGPATPSPTSS